MDHRDHVALLLPAVEPGGRWADIGAGEGAFTLALADLLGPGGLIVAVDRDSRALAANVAAMQSRFPRTRLTTLVADFASGQPRPPFDEIGELDRLEGLDGLVAANSLHFVAPDRQVAVVRSLAEWLRPGGRFVVVEYDADRGNRWVPHPFSYRSWEAMSSAAGLADTRRIGRVRSGFLGAIYAADSRRT